VMFASDPSGGFAGAMALEGDLHARIKDFLARKDLPWGAEIDAFFLSARQAFSEDFSREKVKSALRALLRRLHLDRRTPREDPARLEWLSLVERIHRAGREDTIEGYAAYLVTVEVMEPDSAHRSALPPVESASP